MPKVKAKKSATKVVPYVRRFKPQTEKQQLKALGFESKETIPRPLIADKESFKPIPP